MPVKENKNGNISVDTNPIQKARKSANQLKKLMAPIINK